jgi:hypothetical protein
MNSKFFETFEEMVDAIPMSRDPECAPWPQGVPPGMGMPQGGKVQAV